ncbi:MAG: hypothetical protein HYS15_01050 [Candidatus Spechtbacteria bacterium]|nr:hypothetical protein [Candidatus Spechtbacteria bacterium]
MDAARELKKAREEITKFEETIHGKILERQKLEQEIKTIGEKTLEAQSLARELSLKRSLLGRLDLDLTRLRMQKMRLEREIPLIEREFQRMEREKRVGGGSLFH